VGMPPTLQGNATPLKEQSQYSVINTGARALGADDNEHGQVHAGGQRVEENSRQKKVDKQSMEYILKTGLAGGLAGCAVRHPESREYARPLTNPSRPRQ